MGRAFIAGAQVLTGVRASYWRRRVIALLLVLLGALLVLPVALGFLMIADLTRKSCTDTVVSPNLTRETVTFPSGELTMRAYFIPGSTDATVIIAPPLNSDAGGQLDYGAMFHELGLNVLSITSRRCVGVPSTLGYLEGGDVRAAYDYLSTRDDINPARVSVHGFSASGAAALFGAAHTPELRAVSAMGNYYDFEQTIGLGQPSVPFVQQLYVTGLQAGFRASTGISVRALKPIEAVRQVNPRPVLLVYGTGEPRVDADKLHAAAENSTLWLVEGVGHGGYIQAYPDEAREIIGGFHTAVLLGGD